MLSYVQNMKERQLNWPPNVSGKNKSDWPARSRHGGSETNRKDETVLREIGKSKLLGKSERIKQDEIEKCLSSSSDSSRNAKPRLDENAKKTKSN